MTDEVEEDEGHTCEHVIEPDRFDRWKFYAILSTLMANFCRPGLVFFAGGVNFWQEMSEACIAHSMWASEQKVNTEVVDSFREQLNAL